MSALGRELESFFNTYGKADLAEQAGRLAVEARKLEDQGKSPLEIRQSKIELPAGVRRLEIKSDPLSKDAFAERFEQKNRHVTSYAQRVIDKIKLTGQPVDMEIVFPTGRDLGVTQRSPFSRYLEAGQAAGLNKLHSEMGLYLGFIDENQPRGWYLVAHDPINIAIGRAVDPEVLELVHDDNGLWLNADWVDPRRMWDPGRQFAFGLRK